MRLHVRLAALGAAIALPMTGLTGVAAADNIGNQGCTPGYWKNHVTNWEEYSPSDTLGSVFSTLRGTAYEDVTLEQALALRGGPGVDGATQILLRAATAAVLNAAHEGLGYPYRRFQDPFRIIAQVNAALASGDRQTMLSLATTLDTANNLGCPL